MTIDKHLEEVSEHRDRLLAHVAVRYSVRGEEIRGDLDYGMVASRAEERRLVNSASLCCGPRGIASVVGLVPDEREGVHEELA